jgi:hypothetical protein
MQRRKLVVTAPVASRLRIDNTIIKALARAFRWRKLLETGVFATVVEIAARYSRPTSSKRFWMGGNQRR